MGQSPKAVNSPKQCTIILQSPARVYYGMAIHVIARFGRGAIVVTFASDCYSITKHKQRSIVLSSHWNMLKLLSANLNMEKFCIPSLHTARAVVGD